MNLGSNSVLHSTNKIYFGLCLHDFKFLDGKEKPSITVIESHISKYNENHMGFLSNQTRCNRKDWKNYMFTMI